MKNNEWRTFFIGIFFCLMIGLAFGSCTGGYDEHPSYDYEVGYEEGLEDGYQRGYENGYYDGRDRHGYDDSFSRY